MANYRVRERLGFFLHMQAPPRLRHRMLQGLGEGSIWGAPSLLSPPVVRGPGGPVHQRNLLPRNIFGRQASVQRYDIVLHTHTDRHAHLLNSQPPKTPQLKEECVSVVFNGDVVSS